MFLLGFKVANIEVMGRSFPNFKQLISGQDCSH